MDWNTRRDRLTLDHLRRVAVAGWRADPVTLAVVNVGINVVARFTDVDGRGLYLRAAHPSIRTQAETHAAYEYLVHLAESDVAVCKPIPAQHGDLIAQVDFDDFYATVVTEVPGDPMRLDGTDMTVFEAWGQSLGVLHNAAATYTPSTGTTFSTFGQFWANVRPVVPLARPEIQQIYAQLDAWMQSLPDDDIILTHGDYRPGNVIWDGEIAWAVDFDEPVYNWAITDVARALLEYSDRDDRHAIKAAFLRGYRRVRPLDVAWVARLPELMQLRGTIMHLWDLQGLADDGANSSTDWAVQWALNRVDWG